MKGALAGAAAGLLASFVMNQFQAVWSKADEELSGGEDEGEGGDEPSTVKAADKVARAATGDPLPEKAKEPAARRSTTPPASCWGRSTAGWPNSLRRSRPATAPPTARR
jgi:hypothetical protein